MLRDLERKEAAIGVVLGLTLIAFLLGVVPRPLGGGILVAGPLLILVGIFAIVLAKRYPRFEALGTTLGCMLITLGVCIIPASSDLAQIKE